MDSTTYHLISPYDATDDHWEYPIALDASYLSSSTVFDGAIEEGLVNRAGLWILLAVENETVQYTTFLVATNRAFSVVR